MQCIQRRIDLQGHRGARGLAPENTLAGFRRALAVGVTTIETDLAVTGDGVVVLTHDTRLNPDITRDAQGRWLSGSTSLVRDLTLAELQRYDVGRIDPSTTYAGAFPAQIATDGETIPTLDDLLALRGNDGRAPQLNLEIKSSPLAPDETVDPATFVRLVVAAVRRGGAQARTTLQSFDWRVVLAARALAPDFDTSCLTADLPEECTIRGQGGAPSPWLAGLDSAHPDASLPELVRLAGARMWAPYWRNIDAAAVAAAQALGLAVVPWTVNEPAEIARLIGIGIDGLITDYPDRARSVMNDLGVALR